ncbi:MAG: hypothetical protein QNJ40_07825 [Xanthomonadales bacterium]|nr:hypothetical protein [Xanthomonadales bacterium]
MCLSLQRQGLHIRIFSSLILVILTWPLLGIAQIERISVTGGGGQADSDSYNAQLSDDGSVIVFRSNAENLIADDTNGWSDVFVHDLNAGTVERVSVLTDGSQSSRFSTHPSISDDGQLIVFEGRPTSNVAWPTLYDRSDDSVLQPLPRLASGSTAAGPQRARNEPQISGNGQFLLFHTWATLQNLFDTDARPLNDDSNSADDVFVFDLTAQPIAAVERVSRDSSGNSVDGDSLSGSLSDDGRYVAFFSYTNELVPNDLNGHEDVFLKDRDTGTIDLVSVSTSGAPGNEDSYNPMVSGNGQFIVFRSLANDLVTGDSNNSWDIFVRDRNAQVTQRVSVSSAGQGGDNHSFEGSISDDGRYVTFRSAASNLVADDANGRFDIFVHDRTRSLTERISAGIAAEADGNSFEPAISGDGRWIVFESDATNLVAGDSNQARDIFRAPNPLFEAGGNQDTEAAR